MSKSTQKKTKRKRSKAFKGAFAQGCLKAKRQIVNANGGRLRNGRPYFVTPERAAKRARRGTL